MISGFDTGNYGHSVGTFMPYGSAPIFAATTMSGIIFSFNAFQTIINMGSEIKSPEKNIARGMLFHLQLVLCFISCYKVHSSLLCHSQ